MVKANELRIGNWVQYNPKAVDEGTEIIPLQIEMISFKEQDFIASLDEPYDNNYFEGELLPIPLTEKWLLEFGFEWEEGYKCWQNEIALYKGNDEYPFNYSCQFFEHQNLVTVYYIHQLQNLYFALTGQELIRQEVIDGK